MKRGIVATGNWIVDRVKMIDRWPNEGELCNILGQQASGGGGACNVLFDLAAMACGIPLHASGVVGRDSDGEFLLEQIRANGIDDRHMIASETAATSYTDVMTVRGSGRRTFFHNRGANAELDAESIAPIDVPARLFYLGYLLLLDGLDEKDPEHGTVAAGVLKRMRAKGYRTVVDIVSEDSAKFKHIVVPALQHIDYLIINEVEAGACEGRTIRRDDESIDVDALKSCVQALMEEGVQELVVVHLPEGAVALDRDGTLHTRPSCRIEPEEIVGSVGAGDAFCAGMLYAIHEGLPVPHALDIGAASAWFNLHSATASDGAPTLDMLQAHLASCEWNDWAVGQ